MKGKEIYVMFQEIVEGGSTIRQTVDSFENQEEAQAELESLAKEERKCIDTERSGWEIAEGSPDYFEAVLSDDIHNNHSTIKIVKTVVR